MIAVIYLSKIIGHIIRFFRFGGGTAFPGILIEIYFPHIITHMCKDYKKIVLVTGTNGKTTTQKLISHILTLKGIKVASNKSGANILRGIASSIVSDCNVLGKVRSEIAVFEVEEATMPYITELLNVDIIIVTNLYRDQLDAYGEILKIREYIVDGIKLAENALLILNSDDDNVASISDEIKNKCILFHIKDKRTKDIFYERRYFKRKKKSSLKNIYANKVKIEGDLSTRFEINCNNIVYSSIKFSSPGIHSIYNAIAAVSAVCELDKFDDEEIRKAFSSFVPAFGRGEIININKKSIRLLLVKNPASFNANLQMLKNTLNLKLMIIINDNIADGKDVSWLWDSKVELLSKNPPSWLTICGNRAYDMALRIKYAEVKPSSFVVEPSISKALDLALPNLHNDEVLFVLPTYTAMLSIRNKISKMVKIKEFWK